MSSLVRKRLKCSVSLSTILETVKLWVLTTPVSWVCLKPDWGQANPRMHWKCRSETLDPCSFWRMGRQTGAQAQQPCRMGFRV